MAVLSILALSAILVLFAGLALIRPLKRVTPDRSQKYLKPFGIIGILSGLAAIIVIAVVGDTFGFPGSTDYKTYEIFNRTMAFILAAQIGSLLAFLLGNYEQPTSFSKNLLVVALAAWFAMAVGTAAEFWLFSDLPYSEINFRSTAFSLFSMGSLIAGLSFLLLGLRIIRSRILPWYFGAAMMLYLPLDVALFVADQSIFLAPAIGAIVVAVLAFRSKRNADVPDYEPA